MKNGITLDDIEKKYKAYHQELKHAYDSHLSRLEDKIIAQNSNISEAAIAKAFSIFYPMIGIFAALIGLISYFGYDDIKTSLIDYSGKKVDAWMAYEDMQSPLRDNMLDIKDRYLIDSVYIRLQRSLADEYRFYDFKINEKERYDLIRIANEKNTSLADFSAIVSIFSSGHGSRFSLDQNGIFFIKIFTDEGFKDQTEKQQRVLSAFPYDFSLQKIAEYFLFNEEDVFKKESFTILSNTNRIKAIEYANKNISTKTMNDFDHYMAIFLAENDPQSKILNKYINFLKSDPYSQEERFYYMVNLFFHIHKKPDEIIYNLGTNKISVKAFPIALDTLSYLIDNGGRFYVNSQFNSELRFGKVRGQSIVPSRADVDELFKDENLLNQLMLKDPEIPWILKVVSALEISNNDNIITSVSLIINESTTLVSKDDVFRKGDITGDIWLAPSEDKNKLMAIFRDKAGEIKRIELTKISDLKSSRFSFEYLKKDMDFILPYRNDF